jgi:DNA invertase Pin-like site-specific DNA recombinase
MSAATLTRPVASYSRTARAELPAASYGRVSKLTGKERERGAGASLKVARQHEANREALARHGFDGVAVVEHTDDGISGWDAGAVRPGFDDLLAGVLAGHYSAVAGFNVDRFSRQPEQVERLLAACKATGTVLLTAMGGPVDSALTIRIMAAIAAEESDIKSGRQILKHRQLASQGAFHGGRRRFGYDADMTVREDEAAAIRTVAAMVLNGETLASCARWLTAEGYETVKGGKWTGPNLGTMIKRPHLAGLRVHHKGQPDETVTEATWVPVLDHATREALLVKLGDPDRRTSFSNARVYLLAGLALCGECGAKVRGRQNGHRGEHRASYSCPECHGVHREAARVDLRVTEWVVARLARLDVRGLVAETEGPAAELAELTAQRRDLEARTEALEDEYDEGNMSAAAYARRTKRDEAKLAELDAAIAVAEEALRAPVRALDGLTGPSPREVFTGLPLARQRAVIDVLATVHVDKAARRGAAFDPASVRIEPKDA